ncbi:hypothetical protein GCM10023156_45450 [Novipirellula rosea]|uniref:Uncharacterized protein n=1 Tax=Novipirellula rosea TaxID=1031540 RepID=A0ABP8N988_9BACT
MPNSRAMYREQRIKQQTRAGSKSSKRIEKRGNLICVIVPNDVNAIKIKMAFATTARSERFEASEVASEPLNAGVNQSGLGSGRM